MRVQSEQDSFCEGTSLKQQGILNAWEIIVAAWERKIEFVCVSLTLNAWDLRALHEVQCKSLFAPLGALLRTPILDLEWILFLFTQKPCFWSHLKALFVHGGGGFSKDLLCTFQLSGGEVGIRLVPSFLIVVISARGDTACFQWISFCFDICALKDMFFSSVYAISLLSSYRFESSFGF